MQAVLLGRKEVCLTELAKPIAMKLPLSPPAHSLHLTLLAAPSALCAFGLAVPAACAQVPSQNPATSKASTETGDLLQKNFARPPASARPHTWWHWMNGNITKAGITADLEAMAKVGIGGAQIFNVDERIPAGNVSYMSDEWRQDMAHAAREAKRLGIELCLHNCAGWSSSGGPWIDPAHSMQILTWSETRVAGGAHFAGTLPEPKKRANYYEDIAVIAFRKPTDDTYRIPGINAKAFFEHGGAGIGNTDAVPGATIAQEDRVVLSCGADGSLAWDAPQGGEWVLMRMGHTSTGETNHPAPTAGRGLECDKLSREAMDLHWEKGIVPILQAMGPELVGKSLNNALIDSYEVGTQNWTPKFRAEFQTRRGYDPVPFLPVITGRVVGSAEISERFLWDIRRTAADLYAENYAGRFKELCHKNGLLFSVEPYGNGPFDELQIGTMADIPMGEFWVSGAAAETIKVAASSAHVTGRAVVGAESFTASEQEGRWLIEPYGVKALGDRMFTQGLNRCIFHRYAHQPWMGLQPGMTMGPWGTHLERTITWWEQSKAWMTYLARCQSLLQSGRFVADVLTFSGEDAPGGLLRPSLPAGFDYDGCDRSILMTARVENKQIVLPGGGRYRVLILPDAPWMRPETLAKLVELSRAGATIIGTPPQKSPSLANYPACDAVVAREAARLHLTPMADLARVLGEPDVVVPRGAPLLTLHRRTANGDDLYFVSNQRLANVSASVRFRVTGKLPQLWNPETGQMTAAPIWNKAGNGNTTVTLQLGPAESTFVVFRKPVSAAPPHLTAVTRTNGHQIAPLPVLVIESARYEAVDGAGGADVTAQVRKMVADGMSEIAATNGALGGDPALNHVKRLRIAYRLGSKKSEVTLSENQTGDLFRGAATDRHLPEYGWKNGTLLAYEPGTYTFTNAQGKTRRVSAAAPQVYPLKGPWKLTFPPNLGAPPSVTLPNLISWTASSNPGVKYFSGSATYATTFTAVEPQKGRALILDLGSVKNFAEIQINGKALPVLWKAPWRADVTGLVRKGSNTLSVRVTNLWVNRLIGDEQLPAEVEWSGDTGPIKAWPQWLTNGTPRPASQRVTFTTWRFWTKNDKPLDSGLLGPVRVLGVSLVTPP